MAQNEPGGVLDDDISSQSISFYSPTVPTILDVLS